MFSNSFSKVAFAGLDSAGKTTIYQHCIVKGSLQDSLNQKATRGVERHTEDFLDTNLSIWDFGGQKSYRESYLARPEMFNRTKALIFVVDIQNVERLDEAKEYFFSIINILQNVKPFPKLYVLFHKLDPKNMEELRNNFYKASSAFKEVSKELNIKFTGFATSIYSENINKAISRILWDTTEDSHKIAPKFFDKHVIKRKGKKISSKIQTEKKSEKRNLKKTRKKISPKIPSSKLEKETTNLEIPEIQDTSEQLKGKADSKEQDRKKTSTIFEKVPDLSDLAVQVADRLAEVIVKRILSTFELIGFGFIVKADTPSLFIVKTNIGEQEQGKIKRAFPNLTKELFFATDKQRNEELAHLKIENLDVYYFSLSVRSTMLFFVEDVTVSMLEAVKRTAKSMNQGIEMIIPNSLSPTRGSNEVEKQAEDSFLSILKNHAKNIESLRIIENYS